MNARQLIGNAPLEPETIKTIGRAFDEASTRVAQNFASGQTQSASFKLARALLLVAGACTGDEAVLREVALRIMSDYMGSSRVEWAPSRL